MDSDALKKAGFVEDRAMKTSTEDAAEKNGLNVGGAYVVLGAWKRAQVTLLFEQNTAPEPVGTGLTATVTHPAVCIVSSPRGRVTCNAEDTELILNVVHDLE